MINLKNTIIIFIVIFAIVSLSIFGLQTVTSETKGHSNKSYEAWKRIYPKHSNMSFEDWRHLKRDGLLPSE